MLLFKNLHNNKKINAAFVIKINLYKKETFLIIVFMCVYAI